MLSISKSPPPAGELVQADTENVGNLHHGVERWAANAVKASKLSANGSLKNILRNLIAAFIQKDYKLRVCDLNHPSVSML